MKGRTEELLTETGVEVQGSGLVDGPGVPKAVFNVTDDEGWVVESRSERESDGKRGGR